MSLIRSIFNGVGSGAGAAWPPFGITFALVGAAIGGPISITLGSIAIATFLAVGISITYFSYKEQQEAKSVLVNKIKRNTIELQISISHYLRTQSKKNSEEDLRQIASHARNSPLHFILTAINDNYTELSQHLKNHTLTPKIIHELITKSIPPKSAPLSVLLTPAFFGFIGTFGATAGCSAGVSGLLIGLGAFSSFAAFPILGISILASALLFGIVVGVNAALEAQKKYQAQEQNKLIKAMHHQLKHAHVERAMVNGISSALSTLPHADQQALSTQIKNHIEPLLHLNAKPSSPFLSFFRVDDENARSGARVSCECELNLGRGKSQQKSA